MRIDFFKDSEHRCTVERDIDHVPRIGDHVVLPSQPHVAHKVSEVVFGYEPDQNAQITLIDGDF
ncbi:MAG: hypothetical protein ACR2PS_05615 [Pseudomonadales bacterium]